MTYKEIKTMVASIGYPCAYYQFPNDTPQAPPFICFFFPNNSDLIADDSNYQTIAHLAIELYTDAKDFDAEEAVETVLANNGMVWTRGETSIDAERMYEVVYEMDVIITKENNNG